VFWGGGAGGGGWGVRLPAWCGGPICWCMSPCLRHACVSRRPLCTALCARQTVAMCLPTCKCLPADSPLLLPAAAARCLQLPLLTLCLCCLPVDYPPLPPPPSVYVLDFPGRAVKGSVKNAQLVAWDHNHNAVGSEVLLQFAKTKRNTYALDFRYPLSPFQALAVGEWAGGWRPGELAGGGGGSVCAWRSCCCPQLLLRSMQGRRTTCVQ
jgi:hypothetical protein